MQDGITNAGTFDSQNVDLSILDQSGVTSVSGSTAQGTELPSQKVQVDPKYSNLPQIEAQLRSIQSLYDTLYPEHQKLTANLAEKETLVEILNDLLENDDAFLSLIQTRKPELLKASSEAVIQKAKETLAKEFGEDFKPSLSKEEAEWDDPSGKDAQYWKRREELLKDVKESQYAKTPTLQEYRKKLKEQREADNQTNLKQIDDAKKQFNMSDPEIEMTTKWAESLTFADIVKMRRFLIRFKSAPGNPPGMLVNFDNNSSGRIIIEVN